MEPLGIGIAAFVLSATLMLCSSALIARWVGQTLAERFWIFLASVAIHLGVICEVTSLFAGLTPVSWLAVQLLLLALAVFLSRRFGTSIPALNAKAILGEIRERAGAFLRTLSPLALAVLLCVIGLVVLFGLQRYLTPVSGFDEKECHASRVLYWIQNQSVFPYVTHNERQNAFAFGSELVLLWPLLFTKMEPVGRMVFWLGSPAAAVGLYLLLRELGASREVSLVGVLILATTPLVIEYSTNLKPDIWLVVFLLGTGFWTVRACRQPEQVGKSFFLVALFSTLSINVKLTALALLPSVLALPWLVRGYKKRSSGIKPILLGAIAGFLLSGLVVVIGFNLVNYGHISGSKAMRETHTSDLSLTQLYTHAVRLPFVFVEFPEMPLASVRGRLTNLIGSVVSFLGADKMLPLERKDGWPGFYFYEMPEYADSFSSGGMIWLPLLIIGLVCLIRDSIRTLPNIHLRPLSSLVVLELPLLFGIVFFLRWQRGGTERFLMAPYVLGLAVSIVLLSEFVSGHRLLQAASIVLIAYTVYSPLRLQLLRVESAISSPIPTTRLDEPFSEPLGYIPPGSHILLVGSQDTLDYPLFAPRNGYSNKVTSWGKMPFDSARMQNLIKTNGVTHVLVQSDQSMCFFHGEPDISTVEMVSWLAGNRDFGEIPLATEGERLFEKRELYEARQRDIERGLEVLQAPAEDSLIFVSPSLKGRVGVDPLVKTPWPVEQGFLWVGYGKAEGLEGGLWAGEPRNVTLRFDVSPGPSRGDQPRTIQLSGRVDGQIVTTQRVFTGSTSLVFNVPLRLGLNTFTFEALDKPTVPAQEGDTRNLIVGLHRIVVE